VLLTLKTERLENDSERVCFLRWSEERDACIKE
jgi:hypothetical protein